jgi:YgiT-type zinc finger domain-containing protein
MKCSIENCSGECQTREITHAVRYHGQVVVVDHVPAEVCSVCGDAVLSPETARHIKRLLSSADRPARVVPLYEYA